MPLLNKVAALPRWSIPSFPKLGHRWFISQQGGLLESRHFPSEIGKFKETQHVDAASAVRLRITPALIPYTIALVEASRLPRPLVERSVMDLLDKLYSRPDRLGQTACVHSETLPSGLVQQINQTYDKIDTMTTDFAACALERISPGGRTASTSLPLSPAEHFRFCRAFYRVELVSTLFRCGPSHEDMNRWFFSRHPPWENEQLACVYAYLETKLDQGSLACA